MALINNSGLIKLNHNEWIIIKEICYVLKPFESVTKSFSGETYGTASIVIPIVNGLFDVCAKLKSKTFSKCTESVVKKMMDGLDDRLGNVERSNTLCASTFCEPRFKNIAFKETSTTDIIKKAITSAVSEKIPNEPNNKSWKINSEADLSESNGDLSVWFSFDKTAASFVPQGTATSKAIIEVQRYLK